ncbi:hypothetical protein VSDG_09867 [Cytospora chrysosperma]|uniref:GPI inositol-deacylase winged helix domain-containing protein n=1 Tax=Cytospora chrysosperma TaxID=252740 RepID=A0A423V953_CYTCH|nr:hypothetical protein VSDG_09867 [Valsa sordida]
MPLSIPQIVDAVAVDTEKERFDPEDRMPNPKEITKCCSSLVVVISTKHGNDLIQLAHFSVKEYLISNGPTYLKPTVAITSIATVCLAYLLQVDHDLETKEIENRFFLALYSAENWTRHAVVAEKHSETFRTLATRFFLCKGAYETWLRLRELRYDREPEIIPPALFYASHEGLLDTCQMLLENGTDVDAKDVWGRTALHGASNEGYEKTVQMLLENGADVNAKDIWDKTALHNASAGGHIRTVQILLENGADVNAMGKHRTTALHYAWTGGHFEVVHVLLENGADDNLKGEEYSTATRHAFMGSYIEKFQMLLGEDDLPDGQTWEEYFDKIMESCGLEVETIVGSKAKEGKALTAINDTQPDCSTNPERVFPSRIKYKEASKHRGPKWTDTTTLEPLASAIFLVIP